MEETQEYVTVVGQYFRSATGKVVHLAPCSRMGKTAVRWHYADRRGLHSVAAEVNDTEWMRLCKHCWPAEAQP